MIVWIVFKYLLTTAREDCWVASASALPSFFSSPPKFKYWDCVCPRNFPRNWFVCRRRRIWLTFLFDFSCCSICRFIRIFSGVKAMSSTRFDKISFLFTGISLKKESRIRSGTGFVACNTRMLRPLQKSAIRAPASRHACFEHQNFNININN